MCQVLECLICHKPSWVGCGAHVEQILGHLPVKERCLCQRLDGLDPVSGKKPSPS